MRVAVVLVLVLVLAPVRASAQPLDPYAPVDPTTALHDANAAATAGDWARVATLVDPLLATQLARADLAEAHRLAGLAAYFANRRAEAEAHFVAYLKLDLDGHLDPALVPPEAVTFFDDVKARHAAELRALRPRPKRYFVLNFVPMAAQFQNGERAKGIVLGSMIGALAITNITSYLVLRSWCSSSDLTCDTPANHVHAAMSLRAANIMSGVGLIATYLYGVYDGVVGYRRRTHEQLIAPYATASNDGIGVGIIGAF
ncbi:MAG: hypothetical protein ACM31C_18880 [Acidobacteriota bacterium]